MRSFFPHIHGNAIFSVTALDKQSMKVFFKSRQGLPLFLMVLLSCCQAMGQLVPLESQTLHQQVESYQEWKKATAVASPLQYYSQHTRESALYQYLFNAKLFLLRTAVASLSTPVERLELDKNLFEKNFFQFTTKYCQMDPRTNFDWGNQVRLLYL